MSDPVSRAPGAGPGAAPGAGPGAGPRQLPVVDLAVAVGRLVLWVPVSVVQEGSSVWDVSSGRVRLVLPHQLRLDVGDRVLLLLRSGRVREARRMMRRRSWESPLVLVHRQVVWITPS